MAKPKINYTKIIQQIDNVSEIDSQVIQFVHQFQKPCTSCTWDVINQTSSNATCEECGGRGYVIETVSRNVTVNLEYPDGITNDFFPGGKIQENHIRITANASMLKAASYVVNDFLEIHRPIDYALIDDKIYDIVSITPQKLNGTIYELTMDSELRRETPLPDADEGPVYFK